MQTFLPYPSFKHSLECLDDSRLGNQVYREAKSLVQGGWENHPASMMWYGHFGALALYGLVGLQVMEERYGKHSWINYTAHKQFFLQKWDEYEDERDPPDWIGNKKFHRSHQSNLLRKNKQWYSQFGWDVPDDIEYYWPNPSTF